MRIIVKRHASRSQVIGHGENKKEIGNPYMAFIEGNTAKWAVGQTRDEAVGALVSQQSELGIEVHTEE